jgi:hypothetical protein
MSDGFYCQNPEEQWIKDLQAELIICENCQLRLALDTVSFAGRNMDVCATCRTELSQADEVMGHELL